MSWYAVAASLVKAIPNGVNIITTLGSVEANSEEEAIGKFVIDVTSENKNHNIQGKPIAFLYKEEQEQK